MVVVLDIIDLTLLDHAWRVKAIPCDDARAVVLKKSRRRREIVFAVPFIDLNLTYSPKAALIISSTIKTTIKEKKGKALTQPWTSFFSSSYACSTPSPHTQISPKDHNPSPSPVYTPTFHPDHSDQHERTWDCEAAESLTS